MRSYTLDDGYSPGAGYALAGVVAITAQGFGGVIVSVLANDFDQIELQGETVDLRSRALPLDSTVGTWSSGQWYASLILTSIAESPGLMRVCWNVQLPPAAPVTLPDGTTPFVRTALLKRLMCGVHSQAGGQPVGGYLIDDFDGTVRTFTGAW